VEPTWPAPRITILKRTLPKKRDCSPVCPRMGARARRGIIFIPMPDGKSMTRLYFSGELAPGRACALPPPQAHHATRVLRLKTGDAVTLFNGDGAEYAAVIARISKDRVTLEVGDRAAIDREAPFPVTLAQAVSSGERMDFTVQKAVELGVAAIQPLASSRSVVRLDAERAGKRVLHWQTGAGKDARP